MLPQVGPGTTAALVLAAQAPALATLWREPAPAAFCDTVVQVQRLPLSMSLSAQQSAHPLLSACLNRYAASAADLQC